MVLLGVVNLLQARSLANEARAEILRAVALVEDGELEAARGELDSAVDRLDEAGKEVNSPLASVVGAVPFVHTEVRAGAAGITAVREATLAIIEILDFFVAERPPLFEKGRIDPAAVELLEATRKAALDHALVARSTVEDSPRPRLAAVRDPLGDVDDTTAALVDVLTGAEPLLNRIGAAAAGEDPFRILVLLENGAELRATGGLMGALALLEIDDGGLSIAHFYPSAPRDPTGQFVSVEAPNDYMSRYGGFLANTTLWSNVNLSPDFPTVADVAGRLFAGVTGIEPDLIARIDLVALGYLLEAFPPIIVDGAPLVAETLATEFLIDSYKRFSQEEQDVYVASVVAQAFDQFVQGTTADRTSLVAGARRAARERRIAFFMAETAADDLFARAGTDGAVLPGDPGDVEVVVQNFAANKIDVFTATDLSADVKLAGCFATGEVSVTLENRMPGDAEFPAGGGIGGNGQWWVSFYLPAGAEIIDLSVDGAPTGGTTDVELGRPVASVLVFASPGEQSTAAIAWQEQILTPEYSMRIQPQPLVVPATLAMLEQPPSVFLETRTASLPTECRP